MEDNISWVVKEFSSLDLKDLRLNKRFIKVASFLMKSPTKSINHAMGTWSNAKSAYRLFDNTKLTRDAIFAPHTEQTQARIKDFDGEVILAIQDSTTLNYTHHPKTAGLKALQRKKEFVKPVKGFHLHNLLITTEDGIPLGLLRQDVFCNHFLERNKKHTAITEKKSYRWLQHLETTHELSKSGKQIITVCDKEADIYEFFSHAEELKEYYVVRGNNDRRLEDEGFFISDEFEGIQSAGEENINISGNGARKERKATLEIKFINTIIKKPKRHSKAAFESPETINLNVIWATEKNCPVGQSPANWVLFTNGPIKTIAHAKKCLSWYQKRWRIEEFHKILKSGCNAENCNLQSFDKIDKYIAIMSIIAYRLFWVTLYNRVCPDRPGTEILYKHEIQALQTYLNKKITMQAKIPTVSEITIMIAKLGGYLARKSDRPPGIVVMWRGWQELQKISDMWLIMHDKRCG